jgi:hypothetical protein
MFADELNDLFTRYGFWHGILTAANLPGFDSEKAEVIKQLVMPEAKRIYRASYSSALGPGLSTRQALEKLAAIHRENGHLVNQAAPEGLKESILEGGRQELIAAMASLLPAPPSPAHGGAAKGATADGLP